MRALQLLGFAVLGLGLITSSLHAALILPPTDRPVDVSQSNYTSIGEFTRGDHSGQTFVARTDAMLIGVRLLVQAASWGGGYPAGSDTIVRLRSLGSNGVPLETPLAQGSFSRQAVERNEPRWITVLFNTPYQQKAGESLALMIEDLTSGPDGWNWYGQNWGDPYPEGQLFHLDWFDPFKTARLEPSIVDLAFQTVLVPEPATMTLFIVGFAGLICRRPRRPRIV